VPPGTAAESTSSIVKKAVVTLIWIALKFSRPWGTHLQSPGAGRVPHVRLSVHGPKMDSSNAFTPSAKIPDLGPSLLPTWQKNVERAAPHLFWPMYAEANMGHPSREQRFGVGVTKHYVLVRHQQSSI
jgi:hypothetical protein